MSRQIVTEYSEVKDTYGLDNDQAIEDLMAMKEDIRELFNNATKAVYGGMYLSNPPVAFQDIGANWEKINVFNAMTVDNPKNIEIDLANNEVVATSRAIVQVAVTGSMKHNSLNTGRTINMRVYNVTKGIAFGNIFPVGVGRNVEDTTLAVIFLVQSDDSLIGDRFELQMQGSGGDTFQDVEFNSAIWNITSVGEFL